MKKFSFPFGLVYLLLLLLGAPPAAQAQVRVTLSGTVQDAKTGENLSGATVRIVELPGTGTAANAYGFFTLGVPVGTYTVEASFVGYAPQQRQLTANVGCC